MLKKLAKYGNSTTLVIDKAILELLNMDESSIVKLQTDGKSLIITPVINAEKNSVSSTTEETTRSAMQAAHGIMMQDFHNLPQEMKAKANDPALQNELKAHFEKHMQAGKELGKAIESNQEYAQALKELEKKFDPKTHPKEYMAEFVQLRSKHFPEFGQMDKELQSIIGKYS